MRERKLDIRALLHLREIDRALNAERDVDRLLARILDAAIDLTGAHRGFLILDDKGQTSVRIARAFGREDLRGARGRASIGIAREVLRSGKSVRSGDAEEDYGQFQSAHGLRSVLCVPLRTGGCADGVVFVDNAERGHLFSAEDLEVLEALADQAAIALRNAALVEELDRQRRTIAELNRRLRTEHKERSRALAQAQARLGCPSAFGGIAGRSRALREVIETLEGTLASRLPVLLMGETGTGKELMARAIHAASPVAAGPFVPVNCAGVPESLLEAELFGWVRGAFSGADRPRRGLFAQADGGTIFLDEVGDMSPAMQAKLLRVLQDGLVRPLGGEKEAKVEARVISATNRDLRALIRDGRFRLDLYYRLCAIDVTLPPLRERLDDIAELVERFVAHAAREAGRSTEPPRLSRAAETLLRAYAWPGNVRELENEVRRAVALCSGEKLLPEHFSRALRDGGRAGATSDRVFRVTPPVDAAGFGSPPGAAPPDGGDPELRRPLRDIERDIAKAEIRRALREARGNKTRAASILGIPKTSLYRRLQRYGLEGGDADDAGGPDSE